MTFILLDFFSIVWQILWNSTTSCDASIFHWWLCSCWLSPLLFLTFLIVNMSDLLDSSIADCFNGIANFLWFSYIFTKSFHFPRQLLPFFIVREVQWMRQWSFQLMMIMFHKRKFFSYLNNLQLWAALIRQMVLTVFPPTTIQLGTWRAWSFRSDTDTDKSATVKEWIICCNGSQIFLVKNIHFANKSLVWCKVTFTLRCQGLITLPESHLQLFHSWTWH